jgi:molybdopterin molybdotransferase
VSVQPAVMPQVEGETGALPWARAREVAYETGRAAARPPHDVPLDRCDGTTLGRDLSPLTDLPAFPTSTVDGWAVRGREPWRIVGQVLAGGFAAPLDEGGTCVGIATGAMVPAGTDAIVRIEESNVDGELVRGTPRPEREWREPGDEALESDVLLPAGTPVTPAVIGLAASCGYDELPVRTRPTAAMLVFGDELLIHGAPGDGRVRDSLGPQVPTWLARLGVGMVDPPVRGPIEDTLEAHVAAIREAVTSGVDLVVTTGGTMRGPVDHLHPALAGVGASYAVNTVEVRPGYPMLLATVPNPNGGTTLLAGLPGNPQSAIVAVVSLVVPALAGLTGRPLRDLATIRLGAAVGGRGTYTHLALVRRDAEGNAQPLSHSASSMLRGLAQAIGFAVIAPGSHGSPGDVVPVVELPLFPEEAP